MGRLFWKFFLAVWLAQIVTFVGAGAVFWLMRNAETRPEMIAEAHVDRLIGEIARTIDNVSGSPLQAIERRWPQRETLAEIFIIDAQGKELLGRTVPADRLAAARAALADPSKGQPFGRDFPDRTNAPEGQRLARPRGAFDPGDPGVPGRAGGPGGPGVPDDPGMFRPGLGAGPEPLTREVSGLIGVFEPQGQVPEFPDARVVRAEDGAEYVVLPVKQHTSRRHEGRPPWAPIVVALIASVAFGAFLAWYFAAPIRMLRGAFDEAAQGNLAQRIGPSIGSRRDELADLGRHYDRMAAQLAALMDGQRRLLHDVSHELRSPLARLQAAIGLARQQPQTTEASFERIEREADRMNDLVGELLTLSRLEAGVQTTPKETVDIVELTAAVVEDARFEASTQGRNVEFRSDATALVKGNADLLHRAIENIVRNALQHTPERSAVEVAVERVNAQVRVIVQDAGPGVAGAHLAEIFEPFVRMPGARSGGHGLGLAIARRVVESTGGTIQARNRQGGGLIVEIMLPADLDATQTA